MWQRFTERARRVVFFAQEEARCRGVCEVDTLHLLLGALAENQEGLAAAGPPEASPATWPPPPQVPQAQPPSWRGRESVAVRLLKELAIVPEQLCAVVEKSLSPVVDVAPEVRDMELTRGSKQVIDLAFDEARKLNNKYIGTEHLLLGLIREEKGLAGRVLAEQGVTLERARQEVVKLQGGSLPPAPDATPKRPWWHFFRP